MSNVPSFPPPPPRLGGGSPSVPSTVSPPVVTPFSPNRPLDAVTAPPVAYSEATVNPVMPPVGAVDTSKMSRKELTAHKKKVKLLEVEATKVAKQQQKDAKRNKTSTPATNNVKEPEKKKSSIVKILVLFLLVAVGVAAYIYQDVVVDLYDTVYRLIVPVESNIQSPGFDTGSFDENI